MNHPTPAPLPGGELEIGARHEAPLLGGAGGGFMVSMCGIKLRALAWNRLAQRLDVAPDALKVGRFQDQVPSFGVLFDLRLVASTDQNVGHAVLGGTGRDAAQTGKWWLRLVAAVREDLGWPTD